jgi:hypothetical protein
MAGWFLKTYLFEIPKAPKGVACAANDIFLLIFSISSLVAALLLNEAVTFST